MNEYLTKIDDSSTLPHISSRLAQKWIGSKGWSKKYVLTLNLLNSYNN